MVGTPSRASCFLSIAFASAWAAPPPTVPGVAAASSDVAKQVVSTPWWPAGTEKQAESVGILSYGLVFMTGMMEVNATLELTTLQELYDVRDIAQAGGAGMEDLVDCLVNAPKGGAGAVRKSFEVAMPLATRPALTVVEMPGEYVFCPTSVTCVAAQPAAGGSSPRRIRRAGAYGVAARGLLHVQGTGGAPGGGARREAAEALAAIGGLIHDAGGDGLSSLVDCIAFLRRAGDASAVRAALAASRAQPAFTAVQVGLEDPRQSVLLRCVAAVPEKPGTMPQVHRIPTEVGLAVATDRFVYTSGQLGRATNGADAFRGLERLLKAAGTTLDDVVNCHFFVKETEKVFDLFAEFSRVFNQNHPPPPSRTEFTSISECPGCAVVAKCVAARRPSRSTAPVLRGISGDKLGVVLV